MLVCISSQASLAILAEHATDSMGDVKAEAEACMKRLDCDIDAVTLMLQE